MIIIVVLIIIGVVFLYNRATIPEKNFSRLYLSSLLANISKIAPDHQVIQQAIDLSKGYLNSLYKDKYPEEVIDSSRAKIAEYPSIPLVIKESDGTIIRAGEDVKVFGLLSPISSIFTPTTSISNVHTLKYITEYDIIFRKQQSLLLNQEILTLHVDINYNYWTGSIYVTKLTVTQVSFKNVQPVSYIDVYLGTIFLGRSTENKNGQILGSYVYSGNNDLALRSIRYTERHTSELGYEWYLANVDIPKADKIYNELIGEGYQIHKDIYSPLFGREKELSDNYLYDSGPSGIYRDCYIEYPMRFFAYQYHSKVCTFGVEFYIWYSKNRDWLIPTLWAIHLLNKYGSPDTKYFNGDSWLSPRQVARFTESKWINIGIQSPYDESIASSVRTAVFAVLETILGYKYNDNTSLQFANMAVHIILNTQVKNDGIFFQYDITTNSNKDYRRNNAVGGFYTSWKQPFVYVATVSRMKQIIEILFNHPDESGDIKPSNAETTFTNAQALRIYDCYKYSHNCTNTP